MAYLLYAPRPLLSVYEHLPGLQLVGSAVPHYHVLGSRYRRLGIQGLSSLHFPVRRYLDPDSGDTVVGLHSLNDNNNEHSFGTSRDVIEHLAISPLTVLDGVAAVILDHVVDGEPQFATWLQTIGHITNFKGMGFTYLFVPLEQIFFLRPILLVALRYPALAVNHPFLSSLP